MQITYHLLSDRGNRKINEDRIGSYDWNNQYCFVLADGLGGHKRGEVASKTVVDTCINEFKRQGFSEFYIREAFELSQENILKKQQMYKMNEDILSTLVVLCISENNINWGHIGDSRLYLFKKKKLMLHTLDHSVVQMLVNSGEIQEKNIRNHPDRSRLLRSVGMEWNRPQYEIAEPIKCEKGISFLIASDGFWEFITEKEMTKCLKHASDVHEWITSMERIVRQNALGTDMDNYSAIGIWIR